MLDSFMKRGGVNVDTARIYSSGDCEGIVGGVVRAQEHADKIVMGTKCHPSQQGGLSADGIRSQLATSLDALGLERIEEFYLHQPDTEHSLAASLECLHQLVQEGKIGAVGMSNYHADEVARACEICAEKGYTPPTVYQGLFNPLNRMVEDELLPVLRANNIQFIAYNPLAAGLLSGKHRNTDGVLEGRFKSTASCLDGGNAALAPRPRTWIHHPPFLPPQIIQITCLVS